MSGTSYKMTKLVGESSESIEDAVKVALSTSAAHVHGQSWAHVVDIRCNLGDNASVSRWQVSVEVGFKVDS